MAIEHAQKWCQYCQRYTLAVRPGTNHILHFLITFLTCGLWAFVWLGQSAKIGGWRCPGCGGKC